MTYRDIRCDGKTLLVLGAGTYQIPVIEVARSMGLRVIAFDADPNAPGLTMADISEIVDIRDVSRCIKAAQKYDIDGIVSICTEVAVLTVASLCSELQLPAIDPNAALCATDKFMMRTRFKEAGVAGPEFRQAESIEEALGGSKEIGYPLIIKPVDSSGSRGVRKVDSEGELFTSFSLAQSESLKGKVILEEYMEGVEGTVESLTYRGHTEILAMSDKIRVPFPNCVSVGLNYPPYFTGKIRAEIKELVLKAIEALGIDQGPTHAEVMVTHSGVKMVEIAARGGGYQIFSDIVRLVSGVDIVHETIKIAMGMEPSIQSQCQRSAILRAFNPQSTGIIKDIVGVEQAAAQDGILSVVMFVKPGDYLGTISTDGERPGYLISYAETRDMAIGYADRGESLIQFDISPASV